MRTLKIGSRKISYSVSGSGRPIIFLPGLDGYSSKWDEVAKNLSKNFKVYTLSMPLYETNKKGKFLLTAERSYKLIDKIILKLRIRKTTIVGHSIGGITALVYTSHFPERIEKLVLISTPLMDHKKFKDPRSWKLAARVFLQLKGGQGIINWFLKREKIVKKLTKILLKSSHEEDNVAMAKSYFSSIPVKNIAMCCQEIIGIDFVKYIESVHHPTLIIYGKEDGLIKKVHGSSLYNNFANKKIVKFKAGHEDIISKFSKKISKIINDPFLQATLSTPGDL